ncbi:hypothetical protein [Flavihumibacter profundi]|jgi:hypothetical protein|uniref:hypothetical protein n=1 Tax=Flavihumibacter profundi TaxID=2716883 RepID=UPI001CC72CA6|nr:hypothetical protein [Flavihumibacter profundi]MBZ5856686.1 hypothetical protein [Flavihumibacter profundi]
MLRKLIPALIIVALITGCEKNSYQTKPQLKLKSQTSEVPFNTDAIFSVTCEFTDKEGDLPGASDSSLVYTAKALNKRKIDYGAYDTSYAVVYTQLPKFPDKSSGEIEVQFAQPNYYRPIKNPAPGEDANDTIVIKIVVKDRAGNVSDTLTSNPIVLYGQ